MSDRHDRKPLDYAERPATRDVLGRRKRFDRTMNLIVVSLAMAGLGYLVVHAVLLYRRAAGL